MFALLLVACGVPESVDSGGVDVAISPVSLSKSWPVTTLYNHGDTLGEPYGSVYVVNEGPDPLDLEVLATFPGPPVLDEGKNSWLDVSVSEDVAFPLASGQQYEVGYWAYGVVHQGDELERGLYTFDLVVTVGGVDKIVRADVILETVD